MGWCGRGRADDAASDGGADVTDRAARWSRVAEDVRSRADVSAKAIGALGTTALTAVGIAKFGDLFPLPAGEVTGWTLAAVIAVPVSFFLMAATIVWFSIRMWHANEPLFMVSDPDQIPDLSPGERTRVGAVYAEAARRFGAASLATYEASARKADAKSAKEVRAIVDEAQQRALLNVARMRAHQAVTGRLSILLYVVFALALATFTVGADYLDSERSQRVTTAKDCADAVDAVRRSSPATKPLLPPICGEDAVDARPASTPPASP